MAMNFKIKIYNGLVCSIDGDCPYDCSVYDATNNRRYNVTSRYENILGCQFPFSVEISHGNVVDISSRYTGFLHRAKYTVINLDNGTRQLFKT